MHDCLVISRHAPYGTAFGREGLDAILMASAFTKVSCLFMDDGVFQLLTEQDPSRLDMKDYSRQFALLPQYEVEKIYVCKNSLVARKLDQSELLVDTRTIDPQQIVQLINDNDFVLSF